MVFSFSCHFLKSCSFSVGRVNLAKRKKSNLFHGYTMSAWPSSVVALQQVVRKCFQRNGPAAEWLQRLIGLGRQFSGNFAGFFQPTMEG